VEQVEGGYRCTGCGTSYPLADDILTLLPEQFDDPEWVEGERAWWDAYQQADSGHPLRHDRGLRGFSRERNLLAPVRERVGPEPVVLELGAGSSRTVAGLWPPRQSGIRYVATDISRPWLTSGRRVLDGAGAAVQCEGGTWPFGSEVADAALVLGVLHHVPDWRRALRNVMSSVKPGGYVLLHEVVEKPRILAGRRESGVHDHWTSPHEGHVSAEGLRATLGERGRVLRWRGEYSPMRFALLHYLRLEDAVDRSRLMTRLLEVVDQGFGRSFGRVRPSLGFAEVMCVWQRD
jgi:SAM-dependent methyltransferase